MTHMNRRFRFSDFKETFTFYLIDKFVIAGIAAMFLVGFQCWAQKYQEILKAKLTVGKMYTDIMVKYRENLIDVTNDYFLLIDQLKIGGKPKEEDKKKMDEYTSKIIQYTKTLCTVNDFIYVKAGHDITSGDTLRHFDKEGKNFISELSKLNNQIILGTGEEQISSQVIDLQSKYHSFLEENRQITVEIMKDEMAKYGKYEFLSPIWDWFKNWFKIKNKPHQQPELIGEFCQ